MRQCGVQQSGLSALLPPAWHWAPPEILHQFWPGPRNPDNQKAKLGELWTGRRQRPQTGTLESRQQRRVSSNFCSLTASFEMTVKVTAYTIQGPVGMQEMPCVIRHIKAVS